jgi:hypothetical protein
MQGPTIQRVEPGLALFVFLISLREELRARAKPSPRYAERDRNGRLGALARQAKKGAGEMRKQEPITIERVERGLAILAYMMELDGPVYAPLYENLERALDELHRQEDTVARARRRLESYRDPPLLAPPSE